MIKSYDQIAREIVKKQKKAKAEKDFKQFIKKGKRK